jgi:hypothetical protein
VRTVPWWGFLLLGWVAVAVVGGLFLGAAADTIKEREMRSGERRYAGRDRPPYDRCD